jgi:hypothetical protein
MPNFTGLDASGGTQTFESDDIGGGVQRPVKRVTATSLPLPTGAATEASLAIASGALRAPPPGDATAAVVGSTSTTEVAIGAAGHYIVQALGGDGIYIRFGATGLGAASSSNGFALLHGQSIERYFAAGVFYRAIRMGSVDSSVRVHSTGA